MKHVSKLLALSALCTLLTGLTSCNEEPEYAQTVLTDLSSEGLTLFAGETYNLVVSAPEANNLSWASSNTKVATVENGTVTALADGKTNITASDANGNQLLTVKLTVYGNCLVVYENGKELHRFKLGAAVDYWWESEQISEDQHLFRHDIYLLSKDYVDEAGNVDWSYTASGVVLEINMNTTAAWNGDYDTFIGINSGEYEFYDSDEFHYTFYHTDYEDNETEFPLFGLGLKGPECPKIKVEKNGKKYTFKLKGTNSQGREFFIHYSGTLFAFYD